MHQRLRIKIGELSLSATLTHAPGAAGLWGMLPVRGQARVLPGEIALALPAPLPPEGDRRTRLGIGELAYREQSQTLSVFHAATPASLNGEPRTEVPVTALGMLEQEPEALEAVREGDGFVMERYPHDQEPRDQKA